MASKGPKLLLALRIPSGWAVVLNNLIQHDDPRSTSDGGPDLLPEDLLILETLAIGPDGSWASSSTGVTLHVSWRIGASEGRYVLTLVRGSAEDPLVRLEFGHQVVLKQAVELSLQLLTEGYSPEFARATLQELANGIET